MNITWKWRYHSAPPLWVSHFSGDTRQSLASDNSCLTGHRPSGCPPENQNAPWLLLTLYDFVTSKELAPEQQNGKWHSREWSKIRQTGTNKWILTRTNEVSGAGVFSERFHKFLWLCVLLNSFSSGLYFALVLEFPCPHQDLQAWRQQFCHRWYILCVVITGLVSPPPGHGNWAKQVNQSTF